MRISFTIDFNLQVRINRKLSRPISRLWGLDESCGKYPTSSIHVTDTCHVLSVHNTKKVREELNGTAPYRFQFVGLLRWTDVDPSGRRRWRSGNRDAPLNNCLICISSEKSLRDDRALLIYTSLITADGVHLDYRRLPPPSSLRRRHFVAVVFAVSSEAN